MKWIKTFESFNEDSDEDLFINYLQYVTDDNNLFEIKDTRFLSQGYLFITSDNFEEGYFYRATGPIDRESKYITTNRSSFCVTILKRSYEDYPEAMSSDKGEYFFKSEYPKLYSDLENYKAQMRKLHSREQFEFEDSMITYLISGREFKFYQIKISFKLRRLKEKETPHYRTKQMLKQLTFNDEEKRKLKEIGYELDESIKVKNITSEDVIKTIKGGGRVFATIIKDYPNNDPKEPLTPVSIDDDGLVTVEYDGKEYEVDLENIEKIDIPGINEGFTIDKRSDNFIIYSEEDYSEEGNKLRDEVLNDIQDILYHFIDEDYKVEVGYGYPQPDELEFELTPKDFVTEVDINHVQMLNDYLVEEDFAPIQSNILKELDIHIYYNNSRIIKTSSLPRFKYMIKGGFKANKINFKFKIPNI